jgi:hypothetical protein
MKEKSLMSITRSLAFAALAALSLGFGSAMADEAGGPTFPPDTEWRGQPAAPVAKPVRHVPQAGSADRPAAQPYLGVSDFSTAGAD